jgi:uncharacterized membrane protein YcaP (DUF421 family)
MLESPFAIDWNAILLPQTPIAEIFVRGTVIYLGLFVMLRLVLKRESGGVSLSDVLVVVLLADASQNSLAPESTALADGRLLVATIIFWAVALNWLGFRWQWCGRFTHPQPLPLVRHGKPVERNMRRELITREELMSQLRMQGHDDLSTVDAAYIEGDGRISVIPTDNTSDSASGEAATS